MDLEMGGEFQERRSLTGAKTQKYFLRLGHEATWDINKDLRLSQEFDFYPQGRRTAEPSLPGGGQSRISAGEESVLESDFSGTG